MNEVSPNADLVNAMRQSNWGAHQQAPVMYREPAEPRIEYTTVWKATDWLSQIRDPERFPSKVVRIVLEVFYWIGVVLTWGLLRIERLINKPIEVRVPVHNSQFDDSESEVSNDSFVIPIEAQEGQRNSKKEFKFDILGDLEISTNQEIVDYVAEMKSAALDLLNCIPKEFRGTEAEITRQDFQFVSDYEKYITKYGGMRIPLMRLIVKHFVESHEIAKEWDLSKEALNLLLIKSSNTIEFKESEKVLNDCLTRVKDQMTLDDIRQRHIDSIPLLANTVSKFIEEIKVVLPEFVKIQQKVNELKEEKVDLKVKFFTEMETKGSINFEEAFRNFEEAVNDVRKRILNTVEFDLGGEEKSGDLQLAYNAHLMFIRPLLIEVFNKHNECIVSLLTNFVDEFYPSDTDGPQKVATLYEKVEKDEIVVNNGQVLEQMIDATLNLPNRIKMHEKFMEFIENFSGHFSVIYDAMKRIHDGESIEI